MEDAVIVLSDKNEAEIDLVSMQNFLFWRNAFLLTEISAINTTK